MAGLSEIMDLAKSAKGTPVIADGWVAIADQNVTVLAPEEQVVAAILVARGSVPLIPPDWLLWFVGNKPALGGEIPETLAQAMWEMVIKAVKRVKPWLGGEQ